MGAMCSNASADVFNLTLLVRHVCVSAVAGDGSKCVWELVDSFGVF